MIPHVCLQPLITAVSALPDLQPRTCAILGLVLALFESEDGAKAFDFLAPLALASPMATPVPRGRFFHDDGSYVSIDPAQKLTRAEFHALVVDVAALSNPATREAAVIHLVASILSDPEWIAG